jgi:uncharacterized membrane protein YkoI
MFAIVEALTVALILLAAAPANAAAPPDDIADGQCLADWSRAALVVRMQSLKTAQEVRDAALAQTPGARLVQMTLCRENGRFLYRVVVIPEHGSLTTLTLDAR